MPSQAEVLALLDQEFLADEDRGGEPAKVSPALGPVTQGYHPAPSRGRAAIKLGFVHRGDLTKKDLEKLEEAKGTLSPGPAPLQKIRSRHHKLAKLIATGTGTTEAALLTGFSISRVSILKSDPAFKQLVHEYSEVTKEIQIDVEERIAGVAISALEELQERLEENPEAFKVGELLEITTRALDRCGHGPSSTTQSQVLIMSGRDIEELKQAAKESHGGRIQTGARSFKSEAPIGAVSEGEWTEVGGPLDGAESAQEESLSGD